MHNTSGCQKTYDPLLADDWSLDVTIETSDDPVMGHSVVLCAASEAIRGLLRNGKNAEADHKHLSWREFSSDVCTFFLALLYLGESKTLAERRLFLALADPPVEDKQLNYEVRFDLCEHMDKVAGTRVYEHAQRVGKRTRTDIWFENEAGKNCCGEISIAGRVPNIYTAHWLLMKAYHGRAPPGQQEENESEEETEEEAGDAPWDAAESVTPRREWPNPKTAPIPFLLGAMALAKLYLIPHILQMATQALKYRLSYDNFDQVCGASIQWEVTVMRLHCVQYAMTNKEIRDLFYEGGLSSAVESELIAWFGERESGHRPRKRRKRFVHRSSPPLKESHGCL